MISLSAQEKGIGLQTSREHDFFDVKGSCQEHKPCGFMLNVGKEIFEKMKKLSRWRYPWTRAEVPLNKSKNFSHLPVALFAIDTLKKIIKRFVTIVISQANTGALRM